MRRNEAYDLYGGGNGVTPYNTRYIVTNGSGVYPEVAPGQTGNSYSQYNDNRRSGGNIDCTSKQLLFQIPDAELFSNAAIKPN